MGYNPEAISGEINPQEGNIRSRLLTEVFHSTTRSLNAEARRVFLTYGYIAALSVPGNDVKREEHILLHARFLAKRASALGSLQLLSNAITENPDFPQEIPFLQPERTGAFEGKRSGVQSEGYIGLGHQIGHKEGIALILRELQLDDNPLPDNPSLFDNGDLFLRKEEDIYIYQGPTKVPGVSILYRSRIPLGRTKAVTHPLLSFLVTPVQEAA